MTGCMVGCLNEAIVYPNIYRVGHLLTDLGWVDLDLECSPIMNGQ